MASVGITMIVQVKLQCRSVLYANEYDPGEHAEKSHLHGEMSARERLVSRAVLRR
jgi:hypothetical protein